MSIRFDRVSKSFGTKTVLRDVSFEVASGEILFILGRSGMGKSVTLKHIVGMLEPDQGQVFVDGQNVSALAARRDGAGLAAVRRKCGMVFQHPALLDSLTVFENVAFGLKTPQYVSARGGPLSDDQIQAIVREKLALVNLETGARGDGILGKRPPEISYGMQKRVSLARTLAPGPSYLLFDEPTTGLDPITTRAVGELIRELSRKLGVTCLVVSHDMGSALDIADRVLVLDEARILALGTTAEIQRSQEPLIQDFLRETLAQREAGHA